MSQVKFLKSIPDSAGYKEMESTDDITLNSFSGNGAYLTNLNMFNVSSGVLSKSFYDPSMAGNGITFSSGVLSVSLKDSFGIRSDNSGLYVDCDGTTIGLSGGKLAVLPSYTKKSFSTINFATEDDILALSSSDTLNFVAGPGMAFTTDASTRTITFISSGGSGGFYTAGTGLKLDSFYEFSVNYLNLNYWENTQNIGGFTGSKLIVNGESGDLDNSILEVKHESLGTTFGVNREGKVSCKELHVESNVFLESISVLGSFKTSILPDASDLRNLGDSTHRWEDIYVDDLIGTSKTISVNNLLDKDVAEKINGAWSFKGPLTIGDSITDKLAIISVIDSNILPDSSNLRSLGGTSNHWKDIFVNNIVDTSGSATPTTRFQFIPKLVPSPKPIASESLRGQIFIEEGGVGISDSVSICLKDSSGNYVWQSIF